MPYDRVQVGDSVDPELVNRIQTNIARAVAGAEKPDPLVTVTFTAGSADTRIYHNLGRPLVGYRIVRARQGGGGPILIYDGGPSLEPTRYFNVQANAPGTATFEVF